MNKKATVILVCVLLVIAIVVCVFLAFREDTNISDPTKPVTGNNTVITTNSNSTIRFVSEYDENMFKGKNTILFFWASWCPNCATEMQALNEILKKYKDDKDLNIVFIAHEFEQEDGNIDNLLNLLEGGSVDFDTEILVDYKRIIRKHIDPEEQYIPRTYFLDKDSNVLEEIESAVTVEQVEKLISKYYK